MVAHLPTSTSDQSARIDEQASSQPSSALDLPDGLQVDDTVAGSSYVMPSQWCVQIDADVTVTVTVDKEYQRHRPVYYGGYKHRMHQTTHLHAATQTVRYSKQRSEHSIATRTERTTQTEKYVTRSQQTYMDAGTQMSRADYLLDRSYDRYMCSSGAVRVSGDEMLARRQVSAVEIQCFLRSCFAYRRLKHLVQSKQHKVEMQQQQTIEAQAEQQRVEQRQLNRRLNPRTAADFALLHAELVEWKRSESERIQQSAEPQCVIQEKLELLLQKEVKLLQTIDKLRHHAAQQAKNERIETELAMTCSAREWIMSSLAGQYMQVHTPQQEQAKSLVQLYHALTMHHTSTAERVEILDAVQSVIEHHQSIAGVHELQRLIDRERDLMSRNRPVDTLAGLRQRIVMLYLQLVRNPMVNTSAEPFAHIPSDKFIAQHAALMKTQTMQHIDADTTNNKTVKYGRTQCT